MSRIITEAIVDKAVEAYRRQWRSSAFRNTQDAMQAALETALPMLVQEILNEAERHYDLPLPAKDVRK